MKENTVLTDKGKQDIDKGKRSIDEGKYSTDGGKHSVDEGKQITEVNTNVVGSQIICQTGSK